VEAEARRGNGRGVAPGEERFARQRAARRIEARRDRVARVAGRTRPARLCRRRGNCWTRRVAHGWRLRLPRVGASERQRQHHQAGCDAPDGGGSPEHGRNRITG
jgi:hypothetical protein